MVFSSNAMSIKVEKEIVEKGFQNRLAIVFCPFSLSKEHLNDADVIMVCPHQKYMVKRYVEENVQDKKPVYLIPPKMYGTMEIEEIYLDVLDILEEFNKTHLNPFHFEGEDDIMRVKQDKAYRHYKNK